MTIKKYADMTDEEFDDYNKNMPYMKWLEFSMLNLDKKITFEKWKKLQVLL
jgi:hypothetical protein